MSINRWMARQILVRLYNGILVINKKKWYIQQINQSQKFYVRERSQTQNAAYCMIPVIWQSRKKTIYRDWNQISCCQELEVKRGDWLPRGTREPPRVMQVFCILIWMFTQLYNFVQTHLTAHFKRVNFTISKLYFNKSVFKKYFNK